MGDPRVLLTPEFLDEITGGIADAGYKLHTGLAPSAPPRLRVNQTAGDPFYARGGAEDAEA